MEKVDQSPSPGRRTDHHRQDQQAGPTPRSRVGPPRSRSPAAASGITERANREPHEPARRPGRAAPPGPVPQRSREDVWRGCLPRPGLTGFGSALVSARRQRRATNHDCSQRPTPAKRRLGDRTQRTAAAASRSASKGRKLFRGFESRPLRHLARSVAPSSRATAMSSLSAQRRSIVAGLRPRFSSPDG